MYANNRFQSKADLLVTHVTVMKIGVLLNRIVCDQIQAIEQSS